MYIMSFILVSGTASSHFADKAKPSGTSYNDKGNVTNQYVLLCNCNLIVLFQYLTCGI